jgi:hypothetical protein
MGRLRQKTVAEKAGKTGSSGIRGSEKTRPPTGKTAARSGVHQIRTSRRGKRSDRGRHGSGKRRYATGPTMALRPRKGRRTKAGQKACEASASAAAGPSGQNSEETEEKKGGKGKTAEACPSGKAGKALPSEWTGSKKGNGAAEKNINECSGRNSCAPQHCI